MTMMSLVMRSYLPGVPFPLLWLVLQLHGRSKPCDTDAAKPDVFLFLILEQSLHGENLIMFLIMLEALQQRTIG
jgi:hypothetical protein